MCCLLLMEQIPVVTLQDMMMHSMSKLGLGSIQETPAAPGNTYMHISTISSGVITLYYLSFSPDLGGSVPKTLSQKVEVIPNPLS